MLRDLQLGTRFPRTHPHIIAYVQLDGRVQWSGIVDPQTGEPIEAPEVIAGLARSPLTTGVTEAGRAGVLVTPLGPVMVGSRQVLTTSNLGPPRGVVIMGRFLDEAAVTDLTQRTKVALHLWSVSDPALPEAERAAMSLLADGPVIDATRRDVLHGRAMVLDVAGQPALLLRADMPRDISRRGAAAVQLAILTSVVGWFAVLLATWFGLRTMVVGPLATLTQHALRVGTQGDLGARLDLQRADEIGILAGEFDRMVINLEASRRAMVDAAHRAGQAEVAIEMLHNVGNVLTSVTVSSSLISERVRAPSPDSFSDLALLFERHKDDLPGLMRRDGPRVLTYIRALADQADVDRESTARDASRLDASVTHIREILRSQDARTEAGRFEEPTTALELADEALAMHSAWIDGYGITVTHTITAVGTFRVDRHRVLQILSNLISNALQSLSISQGRRTLTLSVSTVEDPPRLRFEVQDSGVGIASEDLARIFASGYTTRPGGSGIGLHSAANMAREIGGTLVAASPGVGEGATFTLEIPAIPTS